MASMIIVALTFILPLLVVCIEIWRPKDSKG